MAEPSRAEIEAAIERVLGQVYDAGAQKGGKPGKRGQVVDWARCALLAIMAPQPASGDG